MFKITRVIGTEGVSYRVEHFASGDPQPTPTPATFTSHPDAWANALGRAAKQALILNRPEEMHADDGRKFRVMVERIPE